MKTIYHILHKCLLIILAVQLLNMSFANLNNFYSNPSPNTGSFHNQIDCAFEYVTEHLLDWDNYVPENGSKTNHTANHLHKTIPVCLYTEPIAVIELPSQHDSGKEYPVTLCDLAIGHKGDINPPPPKPIG